MKRKLTAAEKAARKRRKREFQTVFLHGKMKRIQRPPSVEGTSEEEFIRANADPMWLHQNELWEYIEDDSVAECGRADGNDKQI